MLTERNIAFFIDVDNVGLDSEAYANVLDQLSGMGTILYGKVYGAGERKHKEIYAEAELRGYKMERPMRIKRRGRKDFDARIFVDVVDTVNKSPAIDAVCIVAVPTDMVYLYSYLRSRGVKIIALDNTDDASQDFIDEFVDIGRVFELKFPVVDDDIEVSQVDDDVVQQQDVEVAPATVSDDALDRTDELLREIELLRSQASQQAVVEQEIDDGLVDEQPASIAQETQTLLQQIAELQQSGNISAIEQVEEVVSQEEQPAEPVQEQPLEVEQQAVPQAATPERTPRATYTPSDDGDLIRRIQEIRNSTRDGDEDYIAEIRKLLDGLDD